ncbi:hypothetical protein N7539_003726 [Penicillium diatomitis]|uniref:Uncharacterized protein n=1 Tax=Penicillium diatomitis TaxID=2819901 RepID=A0A9W9XCU7_9EURO|nr:uncharacterized protein N7539_003726 [Penicillium diatomitis]KAJ5488836.1 hypothetical protein N7539_003726 [Penicillium diatomitis]
MQPPYANSFVHETGSSWAGSSGTLHDSSWGGHFSTPLIIQNREDIELTDWWINKLAYWSGQNPYVKTQIYRTAMDHPFSFQAVILVYAARWRAQITGQSNSEEVQRHVGQVRKNIEDAVSGAIQVHDDQLATALAGMALAEGRYGSRQDAEAYLEHAARILSRRPGASSGVEVFFHYVRYILPPLSDMVSPTNRRLLVLFLQRAQELMHRHSSPGHQPQSSHGRTAFQMGSPLFSLLSSGPRPTQVPQEAHVYVVRTAETQEASRSGCLIYITAALWDFKDSVNKTHRFLAYLTALVEEHQLGKHPACETLLWLLLEQTCDADLRDPKRAWSTGQLLQAQRQLRPDLQFHYNELLMSFLSLQMPVRGIDVFQNELESSFGERRHSPYP